MRAFVGYRRRLSAHPNRPVTPEVAGSSPVAPVYPFALQTSVLRCLNGLVSRYFGQQKGSTVSGCPDGNALQISHIARRSACLYTRAGSKTVSDQTTRLPAWSCDFAIGREPAFRWHRLDVRSFGIAGSPNRHRSFLTSSTLGPATNAATAQRRSSRDEQRVDRSSISGASHCPEECRLKGRL